MDGYFEKARFADRQEWERVRWQTWYLLMPNMDKNHVADLKRDLPLPWDKEDKPPVEIPTEADFERIRKLYDPVMKKKEKGNG